MSESDFAGSFEKGFCAELDELSDTLGQTAAELAKTDSFRREFLANVSHELRTPLTMIRGYAEMVRDNLIDNAISHAGENRKVQVALQERGDFVRVEVRDFGDGVPQDELPSPKKFCWHIRPSLEWKARRDREACYQAGIEKTN